MPGAADGDQAGLEDVADFEAVHLAALGDVEVLPSHDVPHADVSPFRAAQEETFEVPVFVEAEARLGEAQQDVLVQLLEVVAFLLEKALRRRPAVLLAVEEIPVEEALQARLEAAVVLVHLAARLGEVLLLGLHEVVDLGRDVGEQEVQLGLDHSGYPSIICTNRRNR